jgi:recombination protein RecA
MAKTKAEVTDDLGTMLADTLNKKFKSQTNKIAYFLEGDDDAPVHVKEFISTGSSILDVAISNRKNGGIPVGKITELTGLEGSGKSLLAAHILANTQKKGGLAIFIDTENAVPPDFFTAVGIDLKKMLYVPMDTVEDIFDTIESIVEKIRSSDKNKLVTIVVDSIAGASTKQEMEADFDKDGYATAKAIIISKAMRKITNYIGRERICLVFTNQLRTKMGVSFGDPWTTSGGKAIGFHSSVRIRVKNTGNITAKLNGKDQIVGMQTKAHVFKNRLGPPQRVCDYEVFFASGIDDYSSWLGVMKDYSLIVQSGAWYTYVNKLTGEEIKFQSKQFKNMLMEDQNLHDSIYDEICDKLIMKYQSASLLELDDVGVEAGDASEDYIEESE